MPTGGDIKVKTLQREPSIRKDSSQSGPSANFDWLMANFDHLVEKYQGKYLVIESQQVIAAEHPPGELRKALDALGATAPLFTRAHPDAWRSVH